MSVLTMIRDIATVNQITILIIDLCGFEKDVQAPVLMQLIETHLRKLKQKVGWVGGS